MPDLERFKKIVSELECEECDEPIGDVIQAKYSEGKFVGIHKILPHHICHESFGEMINEQIFSFCTIGDKWFTYWESGKKRFDQKRYMN